MHIPAHLILSRHNIFYFRMVVPPEVRAKIPGTPLEVRRSLGTREVKTAIRLARKLSVATDEVFTRVMDTQINRRSFCLLIQQIKLGHLELNGVTLDPERPEQEMAQLELLVQRLSSANSRAPMLAHPMSSTLLSAVVEAYCSEKVQTGNWTEKTEQESRTTFSLMQQIIGDQPVSQLGHADLRAYKEALLQLPANLNKLPAYRGKTLAEVIAMKPAPMQANTIRKQLARVSALFEWAVRHGHMDRNYASGIGIKRKEKRDDEERGVYSDAQIKALKQVLLAGLPKGIANPHRKWVPLIGMYSGMRLEEICQLEVEDICEVGGIQVFDINRNGGKRLKTNNSRRIVPMHPELVTLGLLDYVADLRLKGSSRLFPELKRGRDGYSQAVSRWYNRFRKTLNIDRQFHSLRHTVATKLREADVTMDLIADIIGHSRSDLETGRYAKEASVQRKHEALCKLVYEGASEPVKRQ